MLLIACRPVSQGNTQTSSVQPGRGSKAIVQSRVVVDSAALWRSESLTIPGRNNLHALNFTNDKTGWVGSSVGYLYSTKDGGGTWQKLIVAGSPKSYIPSIHFVDEVNGWVAVSKNASEVMNNNGYETEVQHTSDGGESWQRQFFGSRLQICRIQFLNKQEGWLTGRNLEKGAFVLHTTDEGVHWIDAVGDLGTILLNDYGTDVVPAGPNTARIVTARGKVLVTSDGGSSWHQVTDIQDEALQTRVSRLGKISSDGLWVLGGADSKEGVWTNLALRPSTGATVDYRLNDIYLKDAIVLADSQIVACGSMVSDGGQSDQLREGVILYSTNFGSTWTVAYRNTDVSSINAIVRRGNNLWAVGDQGLVVRLESPF
jgi:photosystem II stability/assembly factor-like uncharacterized protein